MICVEECVSEAVEYVITARLAKTLYINDHHKGIEKVSRIQTRKK